MKLLFGILALSFAFSTQAQQQIGIGTGPKTGSNYPMGEDLVRVCKSDNLDITNVETEGSLSNIHRIFSDPKVQFGIVQEDALLYQQGLDSGMMERVKMVFPFFNTDVHLIVNNKSGINKVSDLAGKRVIVNPAGSGSWVTTQLIKQLLGLSWQELTMTQGEGLVVMAKGEADAMWFVAGKPIKSLVDLKADVKLLSISHPKLDGFAYYTKTLIPEGLYPWQKSSVQTYSVKTVLATFAYNHQYHEQIRNLVKCVGSNLEQLQTSGHPKWKDVVLHAQVKWPAHPAAGKALRTVRRPRT